MKRIACLFFMIFLLFPKISCGVDTEKSCIVDEHILPLMKLEALENKIVFRTFPDAEAKIDKETEIKIEITTDTLLEQKPLSTPKIEKIYIEDVNSKEILGNLIYSDIKKLEKIDKGYRLEFNPSMYLKGKDQRIKFNLKVVFNNGSTYVKEFIYRYDEESKIDNNMPTTITINEPVPEHNYNKTCPKAHCDKKICSKCGIHEDGVCGGGHDNKTCSHCKKTYCSKCENHTSCPHDEKGKCTDSHCVAANKVTYCSICNNHTHVGCNKDYTCTKTNCLEKICSVCKAHTCKGDKTPDPVVVEWDKVEVSCYNSKLKVNYKGVFGKTTNAQGLIENDDATINISIPDGFTAQVKYVKKSDKSKYVQSVMSGKYVIENVITNLKHDKGKYSIEVIIKAPNEEVKTTTFFFYEDHFSVKKQT